MLQFDYKQKINWLSQRIEWKLVFLYNIGKVRNHNCNQKFQHYTFIYERDLMAIYSQTVLCKIHWYTYLKWQNNKSLTISRIVKDRKYEVSYTLLASLNYRIKTLVSTVFSPHDVRCSDTESGYYKICFVRLRFYVKLVSFNQYVFFSQNSS